MTVENISWSPRKNVADLAGGRTRDLLVSSRTCIQLRHRSQRIKSRIHQKFPLYEDWVGLGPACPKAFSEYLLYSSKRFGSICYKTMFHGSGVNFDAPKPVTQECFKTGQFLCTSTQVSFRHGKVSSLKTSWSWRWHELQMHELVLWPDLIFSKMYE